MHDFLNATQTIELAGVDRTYTIPDVIPIDIENDEDYFVHETAISNGRRRRTCAVVAVEVDVDSTHASFEVSCEGVVFDDFLAFMRNDPYILSVCIDQHPLIMIYPNHVSYADYDDRKCVTFDQFGGIESHLVHPMSRLIITYRIAKWVASSTT